MLRHLTAYLSLIDEHAYKPRRVVTSGSIVLGVLGLQGTGQVGVIGNENVGGIHGGNTSGSAGVQANLILNYVNGMTATGQLGEVGNLLSNGILELDAIGSLGKIGNINVSGIEGLSGVGNIGSISNLNISFSKILIGTGILGPSPLLINLNGYWKLDESSDGSIAVTRYDSHLNNNLSDQGTTASAAGKINNAAYFIAANFESLTAPDSSSLTITDIDGNLTLQAWVKLASKGSSDYTIIEKHSASNKEYRLYYDKINDVFAFSVGIFPSGFLETTVKATTFGSPSIGTWYLIHGWHDGINNLIGISVNAGTADTVFEDSIYHSGTGQFHIGANESGLQTWDGQIDEVALWKRILTSEERSLLYNNGNGYEYPFSGVQANLIESGVDGMTGIGSIGTFGNLDIGGIEGLQGIGQFGLVGNVIEGGIAGVIGIGQLDSNASIATSATSQIGLEGIGQLGVNANIQLAGNIRINSIGQTGEIGSINISGQQGLIGIGSIGQTGSLLVGSKLGLNAIAELGSILNAIYQSNNTFNSTAGFGTQANILISAVEGLQGTAILGSINNLLSSGVLVVNSNGSIGVSANLNQNQKAGLLGIAQLLCDGQIISTTGLKFIEFILNINRSPSFTLNINRNIAQILDINTNNEFEVNINPVNEFDLNINTSIDFDLER